MTTRLHRSSRSTGGFTLIEIVLATAVAAILFLAVQSVFFAALRLRNTTTRMIEDSIPLKRTLAIVEKDFAGVMIPGGVLSGVLQTGTGSFLSLDSKEGEPLGPDFYTASASIDSRTSFSEVQRVSYLLIPDSEGGQTKTLVREVARNLLPAAEDQVEQQTLLTGILQASIDFYDGTTWTETWDSASTGNSLPTAIRLSLVLAADRSEQQPEPAPIQLVVPLFVTALTSTTTSGTSTQP
jgi:general secretion pathway protein J